MFTVLLQIQNENLVPDVNIIVGLIIGLGVILAVGALWTRLLIRVNAESEGSFKKKGKKNPGTIF